MLRNRQDVPEQRLNLALVGPIYPYRGGIAHYTMRLYQELVERGDKVSLYSFARLYPGWLFPGRTDQDPSKLEPAIEGEYKLDSLNPFTWWKTARIICSRRPNGLVLQWWVTFLAPVWMLLAMVARRAGIPVVFICHNVLPHERRFWDIWLTRRTLATGNGFIVQSQEEKKRLLALLPDRPVQVVPMPTFDMFAGQAVAQDEARQRLGLPDGVPVLLFFGFVREYKGLMYLLEAMPIIRAELPGVRLLIVGEFWQDKRTYMERMEQLGIEQEIIVVDRYVANEQVPLYFAAADVVVLPYIRISQSAVVQLAFGLGVPVITTRLSGLSELVIEEITGLMVPPRDTEALAEAVCRFFKDSLGPKMETAIEAIKVEFTWGRLLHSIEVLVAHG